MNIASNISRVIIGSGLIALDLILSEDEVVPARINALAGGSCGNVLTILSYLGWTSYPIAQLGNIPASELLYQDMQRWGVKTDYLELSKQGVTPLIIHRVFSSVVKHRFEFRNPQTKAMLPRFKPTAKKFVVAIEPKLPPAGVFYFDRINPATLELALRSREKGALIIFEPSSFKDKFLFEKALSVSHIVKFSQERIPDYQNIYSTCQTLIEIQTLGNDGIKYRLANEGDSWYNLPAFYIEDVVDTAGAGDWCTAGILNSISSSETSFYDLNRHQIEQAIKVGQSMAAINCCFIGARGSMYSLSVSQLEMLVSQLLQGQLLENILPKSYKLASQNVRKEKNTPRISYDELIFA